MRKQQLAVWATLTAMMLAVAGCASVNTKRILSNPQNYSSWRVMKDEPQISTFASLVKSSGLEYGMKTAGNYTIFAPTNAAFKQLPKGTLSDLTKNKNRNELRSLLWYHVALTQITAASSPDQKMGNGGTDSTATISSNGRKILSINNAKIIGGPIYTDNGTIYMINRVLMPGAGK
jgi:uncharacterized surface protein with fasciclin (FAS1) repeats